ncbi:MAG: hypothetical protein ACOCVZ_01215 [Gemmatimonadota bacterium]
MEQRTKTRGARAAGGFIGGLAVLAALGVPTPGGAQERPDEAVMIAAAVWVLDQLPDGSVCVDPHRTGRGKDEARVRRVAEALGADLATLEQTRECGDVMDPATCRLASTLLAIEAPEIRGDGARVRVYAWYSSDSPRQPVGKRDWDVRLERGAQGWQVVGGG